MRRGLVRGTRDARIESAYHATHCSLKFETDSRFGDIAPCCYLEGPLDGKDVVLGRDDEPSLADHPPFDEVMVNEGASGGFYRVAALAIPHNVRDFEISL